MQGVWTKQIKPASVFPNIVVWLSLFWHPKLPDFRARKGQESWADINQFCVFRSHYGGGARASYSQSPPQLPLLSNCGHVTHFLHFHFYQMADNLLQNGIGPLLQFQRLSFYFVVVDEVNKNVLLSKNLRNRIYIYVSSQICIQYYEIK